jgi:PAS domain S-box-containing protein
MNLSENATAETTGGDVRRDRDRFVAFAFSAADAFVELDNEQQIHYATGAINALTGHDGGALVGRKLDELIVPEDRSMLAVGCEMAIKNGRCGPLHLRLKHDSGEIFHIEIRGTYLPINGGGLFLSLNQGSVSGAGVPELLDKESFAGLAHDAIESARNGERPAVMTMLDLEGLSAVLDRMEESEAAALMYDINGYIQARAMDGGAATHIDNDMFSVVHDPAANIPDLEQLISTRAEAADPNGEGVTVHAASIDLAGDEMSDFDDGKALLYTINKFSVERGKFTIKDLEQGYKMMLDDTRGRVLAFKSTVAKGDFEVFFQPIVDLHNRDVDHFEALVRLQGGGAEDSPFPFIKFAEDVGIIAEFDLAMCGRVMRFLESIKRQDRELSVAVNISGRSLETPIFLEKLIQLLSHFSPPRSWLQFEITESSTIHDLDATGKFLNSLRKLGHAVCLDDFGSGASAFHYLRALEVDCVKIDGTYVQESQASAKGKAFMRAIASLCTDLGIDTVAEMVETEASANFLREIGVRYGQGYLFGKPTKDILGWRSDDRRLTRVV